MSFKVEGDYFEACTCRASCPCIMLSPATEDTCDAVLAWHITEGQKDGVALGGLNAVIALRSPQQMTDGNWAAALYLDDRASDAQEEALKAIFTGAAGGHLAGLAPLIGEVTGIERAPISFTAHNGSRSLKVGDLVEAEVAQLTGMDGASPITISNPLLGAVTQPMRQAKSSAVR
jgi:hypothetical protein